MDFGEETLLLTLFFTHVLRTEILGTHFIAYKISIYLYIGIKNDSSATFLTLVVFVSKLSIGKL